MNSSRYHFEVADVIRQHGDALVRQHRTSLRQRQVLFRLSVCRTARLGGHLDACPSCGHTQNLSYNSCRDRHCPKCQGRERAQWIERSLARILPTGHFHVVFTLPDALSPLFLQAPKVLYDLLFRASAQALLDIAADSRHLGADIGFTSILHTWAQNLAHHPHIHCIVTAGGLSPDSLRWVHARPRFLLPVRVLGKRFKHLFLQGLIQARQRGELPLMGSLAHLHDPYTWSAFRNSLYQKSWVVYSKRAFRGPSQLFRYLGNYTHRVGISNHRIVAIDATTVTFTVRDRNALTGKRCLTLDAQEFLRRFLLHVLPKGFVRIRHYGIYASSNLATKLPEARRWLESPSKTLHQGPSSIESSECAKPDWWCRLLATLPLPQPPCPHCGNLLVRRAVRDPSRASPEAA